MDKFNKDIKNFSSKYTHLILMLIVDLHCFLMSFPVGEKKSSATDCKKGFPCPVNGHTINNSAIRLR